MLNSINDDFQKWQLFHRLNGTKIFVVFVTVFISGHISSCSSCGIGVVIRSTEPEAEGSARSQCWLPALRQSCFHCIISNGVISRIGKKLKRFDSSTSNSVELVIPLTTPIFLPRFSIFTRPPKWSYQLLRLQLYRYWKQPEWVNKSWKRSAPLKEAAEFHRFPLCSYI